ARTFFSGGVMVGSTGSWVAERVNPDAPPGRISFLFCSRGCYPWHYPHLFYMNSRCPNAFSCDSDDRAVKPAFRARQRAGRCRLLLLGLVASSGTSRCEHHERLFANPAPTSLYSTICTLDKLNRVLKRCG